MNSGNARDRAAMAAWRRAVAERLQTLHTEVEGVQRLLDALKEQRAVVHEERLCMTAQYRLLADDGCPEDGARQALEQERTLLREESVLAREWLRLLDEQRYL